MNNRPTPETDAARITEKNGCIATFGASQVVSVNFARKLERERDEARQELEEYRSIAENIGAKKAVSEKEKAIRERDEWAAMCGRYKQERDELLNEIKRLRLDAQREAEHHDRMVKELEGLYDQLKS